MSEGGFIRGGLYPEGFGQVGFCPFFFLSEGGFLEGGSVREGFCPTTIQSVISFIKSFCIKNSKIINPHAELNVGPNIKFILSGKENTKPVSLHILYEFSCKSKFSQMWKVIEYLPTPG